LIQKGLK